MLAEGVGFEPTDSRPSTVFKTVAFNRSATLPALIFGAGALNRSAPPPKGGHYTASQESDKVLIGAYRLCADRLSADGLCTLSARDQVPFQIHGVVFENPLAVGQQQLVALARVALP